jgi:hypothetical protein
MAGILVQTAKSGGEGFLFRRRKRLLGEANHPKTPEGKQNVPKISLAQGRRQINTTHRRAKDFAAWFDRQHCASLPFNCGSERRSAEWTPQPNF